MTRARARMTRARARVEVTVSPRARARVEPRTMSPRARARVAVTRQHGVHGDDVSPNSSMTESASLSLSTDSRTIELQNEPSEPWK